MSDPPASDPPILATPVELRRATALAADPDDPTSYRLTISEDWTIVDVFGGVSMYCLLRAITEHISRPDLEVQQMTALFLAPVPTGGLVVDVDVLRNGRRTAQVGADLRLPDTREPLVRAHTVFGSPDDAGPGECLPTFPQVPLPADLASRPHNPDTRVPMEDRTDWRPIDGSPYGDSRLAWERLREGAMHREALVVFGDILGAAIEARSASFTLSLEISIRFIQTPATPWVLQEVQIWHAGNVYASGPARLWDEDGNLCAIVNQTALLRPRPQG